MKLKVNIFNTFIVLFYVEQKCLTTSGLFFETLLLQRRGTVAQWLRCCATNRKVAGSIPAGVIGIFH